jgi:glutamate transport system substrate-binding protein
MRVRTLAAVLLTGALALTACGKEGSPTDSGAPAGLFEVAKDVKVDGSPTFEKVKARGNLVVGVKEDQPGLGYKDPTTNKYSGFDIDIARLISAKLGFDPEKIQFKTIQSAAREQALINGDVDYYVGTYTINAGRKEKVGFAGPYFVAGQDLLVKKDNTDITGKEALKGKKVCSVTGSTPAKRIRDEKLTEPGGSIEEFQGYSQCVTKLLNGEVEQAEGRRQDVLQRAVRRRPAQGGHRPARQGERHPAGVAGRRHLAEDLRRHPGQVGLVRPEAEDRPVLRFLMWPVDPTWVHRPFL